MRHGRLQRRDHRLLLHDFASCGDGGLLALGVRRAPVAVEIVDRPGVDVARGGDAALAAVAHVGEQELLAAGEHVEAAFREVVEHRLGVRPVARGILHAGDDAGVLAEQPLDQAERDWHLRHRRDVIQVKLQPLVADALDHLGEIAVQAFVGQVLVIEGRQHQHAGAAHLERRAGELHRVGQRAMPGARHQRRGRNAARDERLEQAPLLRHRHRVRLAVGAEHGEARAAVFQQPAAVAHEALGVRRVILPERRDDRGEDALDALRSGHVSRSSRRSTSRSAPSARALP